MRDEFLRVCVWLYLGTSLILGVSMGYAYYVNARLSANDPQKQNYHPLAFALLPIWPLELLAFIVLFILRAVLYGLFLVAFTLMLIFVRQPFLLRLLLRAAKYVGDRMLRLNTWFIYQLFPSLQPRPA